MNERETSLLFVFELTNFQMCLLKLKERRENNNRQRGTRRKEDQSTLSFLSPVLQAENSEHVHSSSRDHQFLLDFHMQIHNHTSEKDRQGSEGLLQSKKANQRRENERKRVKGGGIRQKAYRRRGRRNRKRRRLHFCIARS